MKTKNKTKSKNSLWELIAAPFRAYARRKRLTEKDILSLVEEGRQGKNVPLK